SGAMLTRLTNSSTSDRSSGAPRSWPGLSFLFDTALLPYLQFRFWLWHKNLAMKSLFYVEEDFVAGLLKDYFAAHRGGSANFIKRGSNGLADKLSKESIDLFLAQSEDPGKLTRILELVRQQGRKIPTLILTSHSD